MTTPPGVYYIEDNPEPRRTEQFVTGLELDELTEFTRLADLAGPAPGVPLPTFTRDLIIALAVRAGLSHARVAGAMGLKRTTISHIVAGLRERVAMDLGDVDD